MSSLRQNEALWATDHLDSQRAGLCGGQVLKVGQIDDSVMVVKEYQQLVGEVSLLKLLSYFFYFE